MPVINVQVSGREDPALAKEIAKTISSITKDVLNKKPEVTVVTVSFVPADHWFINSHSLAELNANSFNLIIKITDSTNLKDDKARYMDVVHKSLSSLLENIHPVSYTAIHEMNADAYGYEGTTIEYKYIQRVISQQ